MTRNPTTLRLTATTLLLAAPCVAQNLPYGRATPLSQRLSEAWERSHAEALSWTSAHPSAPLRHLLERPGLALSHLDPSGRPIFLGEENLNSANTVGTDDVWPGGSQGLALSGVGIDYLGQWDSGAVRASHQEFGGRVIVHDMGSTSEHATHVAGTLIAAGVDASAKGMAYQASLHDWDWDNDLGKPIADGFYFTVARGGLSGPELQMDLLRHGVSLITLGLTGSCRTEGLRACVSFTDESRFADMERRLAALAAEQDGNPKPRE